MRVGIYDPYLDTLGGGENYVFSIAHCLASHHKVTIFWDDTSILQKAQKRFGIDLTSLQVKPNIFSQKTTKRIFAMLPYDLLFIVSDGSIPLLLGRKNIVILQHPVPWVDGRTLKTSVKLQRIHALFCYSQYVKEFLDKTFPKEAMVLPPCISPIGLGRGKENIIVSVGRFTKAMNTKKHEVLIDVFKNNFDSLFKQWKLVIIGAVLEKDMDYVRSLKEQAKGYPITILHNATSEMMKGYYKAAKIYWHAAGFGEDLKKHPERAEHFGITTVEAMSAGAVPVVINAGGQKEIVQEAESGFLWNTTDELISKTKSLVTDGRLWQQLSTGAINRAGYYERDKFCQRLAQALR
jgi:glycosyltransferase involved in cell wall biosynthesis